MRKSTPLRTNPDGSRTMTVQRCCNGCGHRIGDVTIFEINASIDGLPLPDVRHECPWCAPFLQEEKSTPA